MKSFKTYQLLIAMFSISAILIGGCGGDSSTTPATTGPGDPLKVAEKVSVVDTQQSGGGGKPLYLKVDKLYLAPTDLNSDYYNDKQVVFVDERSAEAFDIVNEILCMLAQSKYDAMTNKGDYRAQIDANKCSKNNDSASSAGQQSQNQSSGSTAPEYENWTVNSSRADNSSPHIVKAWIHSKGHEMEPPMVIFVHLTITESTSATNPYGIFTLNFKSHPMDPNTGNTITALTVFKGFLRAEKDASSGKVLLKFAMEGGFDMNGDGTKEFSFDEKVVVDRAPDGSTGSGTTSHSFTSPMESKTDKFDIAYNSANFRRKNAADDQCFSRTLFDETAWRYGLYDLAGKRFDINSGFPIKKGTSYGWIGYYGLWFPEDVTISNGDTVFKVAYGPSGETSTPYAVIKKEGRLKKHTRHTTTLADIKNIPMDGWMEGVPPINYRVRWNGSQFEKIASLSQDTWMWMDITPPVALNLNALNFGELNFWSQAIGGQVRVKLSNCQFNQATGKTSCDPPTNTTPVVYFTEDLIFPGDTVPASFRCYDNCPKAATASGIDPTAPYYPQDFVPPPTEHNYTFSSSASDMILKDSGNPLIMTSTSQTFQWGVMSGPLFEPTDANLALLACDWNQSETCGWKVWSVLDVYYTWETGPKQWNQFTGLMDANGAILKFSPPKQVVYTHVQLDGTKPDAKYNGTKFYLEYSGFGNLWGIPGKCIDDTGLTVSCGPNTRWVPEFTIPDGTLLVDGSNASVSYYVKALEKEHRMKLVASSGCSTLILTSFTLPPITDWVDPNIGNEPAVTNAPAVIGGVLQ